MTSDRPYRRRMELAPALDEITTGAGTQFDPEVVKVFVEMVEAAPPSDDHRHLRAVV